MAIQADTPLTSRFQQREMENDLIPKRAKRAQVAAKLEGYKQGHPKSDKHVTGQGDRLIAELETMVLEESSMESLLAVQKRTKVQDAFGPQFAAMREVGEKLALLGAYGELLLKEVDPSETGRLYDGAERTANIRVEAGAALAHWSLSDPMVKLKRDVHLEAGLNRSDSRSFGATHFAELAQIESSSSPMTSPIPSPALASAGHSASSTPVSTPSLTVTSSELSTGRNRSSSSTLPRRPVSLANFPPAAQSPNREDSISSTSAAVGGKTLQISSSEKAAHWKETELAREREDAERRAEERELARRWKESEAARNQTQSDSEASRGPSSSRRRLYTGISDEVVPPPAYVEMGSADPSSSSEGGNSSGGRGNHQVI
ncbi:hypothetical protein T439DRAFT_57495 [Meredithblackwellia eburnea MCA 4105]